MTLDEIRAQAASLGYELRRKGRKCDHKAIFDGNGEQLRNCYIPHIVCTASVRARSIKLLEEARVQLKNYFKLDCVEWCDVYEMLLLMAEHVIRNMRFHLNGVELYSSLFYLIDKKDYIRNRKSKEVK